MCCHWTCCQLGSWCAFHGCTVHFLKIWEYSDTSQGWQIIWKPSVQKQVLKTVRQRCVLSMFATRVFAAGRLYRWQQSGKHSNFLTILYEWWSYLQFSFLRKFDNSCLVIKQESNNYSQAKLLVYLLTHICWHDILTDVCTHSKT